MGVKYMNNNQVPQNTDKGLKNILLGIQMQKNTIAIIAGVVGIISLFLPYAKAQAFGFSQSVSYIQTGNGIVLLILILIAMGAYIARRGGIGFILSAIAALLTIVDFMSIASVVQDSYGIASHGMGAYLAVIATIAMTVATFIGANSIINNK